MKSATSLFTPLPPHRNTVTEENVRLRRENTTILNDLCRANREIERLQEKVRKLSYPTTEMHRAFVKKAGSMSIEKFYAGWRAAAGNMD